MREIWWGGRAARAMLVANTVAASVFLGVPPATAAAQGSEGRILVALVDDTASFTHRTDALGFLRRVAASLEPGDELAVLRICADSFGDQNLLLLARMPRQQRSFDPAFHRRLLLARGAVDAAVRGLAPLADARGQARGPALTGRCTRTDIVGALHGAARLLADAAPGRERWLFVLSDMVDDVSRPARLPPSLEGAQVRLLFVERGSGRGSIDELETRVGRWRQVAAQAKAASVVVCDPVQTARVTDPFAELTCGG